MAELVVAFRDDLGITEVRLDKYADVTFLVGFAYFSDDNDRDYKIPAEDIVGIWRAEE